MSLTKCLSKFSEVHVFACIGCSAVEYPVAGSLYQILCEFSIKCIDIKLFVCQSVMELHWNYYNVNVWQSVILSIHSLDFIISFSVMVRCTMCFIVLLMLWECDLWKGYVMDHCIKTETSHVEHKLLNFNFKWDVLPINLIDFVFQIQATKSTCELYAI